MTESVSDSLEAVLSEARPAERSSRPQSSLQGPTNQRNLAHGMGRDAVNSLGIMVIPRRSWSRKRARASDDCCREGFSEGPNSRVQSSESFSNKVFLLTEQAFQSSFCLMRGFSQPSPAELEANLKGQFEHSSFCLGLKRTIRFFEPISENDLT